ncbi:testis-expressed sequence 36 protein-like [Sinocyclocheilus grahami]|uniref:testis-expressed sequence 36 protein-like n=1 Tax=Sinocyclocheilus grahami TaxID=75366 RepID=UPI0007ACDDA4|nr:PREDICTED: testis-expressed sequence 36 protein-like [Sinocyclocheilus grahami]
MSNGGKRYFNKKNKSGNWLIHTVVSQTGQTGDLCTSTGSMLAHGVPQALTQAEERYPKIFINPEKKTMGREYPLSAHDNRTALQHSVDVYDQGFGRKKCFDERRQHNSHFYLCHYDEALRPLSTAKWDHSAYRTDFLPKQETEGREDTLRRRFPRDHSARSEMNATAQAEECFMWFGRDDCNQNTPLSVLAVANLSLTP